MGDTYPKRGDYEYIKNKSQLTFYDPAMATKELVDEIFEKDNTTKYKKRQKKVRDIEFIEVSQSALLEEPGPEPKSIQDLSPKQNVINLLNVLEEKEEKEEKEEDKPKPKLKKVIKLKKGRKLKPTIILVEEEEEELVAPLEPIIDAKASDENETEIPPPNKKPKKKTIKRKHANIKFNPPGKTKTKKYNSI